MPQGEGTYGKQVGRPPAKDYSPYKMKGSPMYRNFGIGTPPKGVAGEAEGGSPAKGWLKKAWGGIKKAAGFTPVGLMAKGLGVGKKAGGGGGDLEARVAALEASASGGGAEAEATGGEAAAADPAAAAAAEGGDPQAAKTAMQKAQAAKAGVGGAAQLISGLSDIRAKEKIEKIGNSPSGIPMYEFNYIGSEARYSGTMAQDLLKMGIDAVSMGEDGYYRVNYNNIDVDMHLIN